MKKKSKHASKTSPVDSLRKETAYRGIRAFFGIPFYLLGCAFLLLALIACSLAIGAGELVSIASIIPIAALVITGLFNLSIPALANALLDIADASLRNDTREAQRDAREAYEQFKANQGQQARQIA